MTKINFLIFQTKNLKHIKFDKNFFAGGVNTVKVELKIIIGVNVKVYTEPVSHLVQEAITFLADPKG